jgi:hypothetical protein
MAHFGGKMQIIIYLFVAMIKHVHIRLWSYGIQLLSMVIRRLYHGYTTIVHV